MRKHQSFQYIFIFILAQVAWLSLLGLWIYRYISNVFVYSDAGDKISRHAISEPTNLFALVGGLVLLIAVSVGMSLIYASLNSQLRTTRLYDSFIANVTHELKSPLASIQLVLETLNKHRMTRRKQKEFLNLMLQDAGRLNNLINSILEISGLEQKKVAHNFHVYNAETVISSLIEEAAEQFKLPRDAIHMTGRAPCRCVVDRDALKIVFNNIIDNAIKYSAKKVQIDARFQCSLKSLIVDFRDQGVGISAKDQKKIFEKFQRIYDQDVPSVKGTGLGLYWVKEIIGYHGGKVSVSSEGKNTGSTFRIELPIYQTSKQRHVNNLLKITQRWQRRLEEEKRGDHV